MTKLKLKATKVTAGFRFMLVQTEDENTGEKGVHAFKQRENKTHNGLYETNPEFFSKMIKEFFSNYESHFSILDMYGSFEYYNCNLSTLFIVQPKSTGDKFLSCLIDVVPQVSNKSATLFTDQIFDITPQLKEEREWNLK